MVKSKRFASALSALALLSACGGGSGGTVRAPGGGSTGSAPTPTPSVAGCSLRERQDWARAQLNEWYLFPETLPASLDPTPYSSVEDYIDALTATARAQHKDRYFTYLTSIAEENAYYSSGSSAGLGVRLATDGVSRLAVSEAFENAPGYTAGLRRGTEILAIGTSAGNLRTVAAIMAASGTAGLSDALGPDTAGTARVLQIADASGTRNVTVTKADFELQPLSSDYGWKILNDGGAKVGYVNLRTFITTADAQLRTAFAQFRANGVTNFVVDLRYNGGGLISIAETLGDLLGGGHPTTDVFDYVSFRPEKAAENSTRFFQPQPQSVAATKIAFIGTGGTASASELVINAFLPYLHANVGLIGSNTYGKPVGQIALDKPACDDRLRVIALAVQNSQRQGGYYTGLAGTVEASCRADDDISRPLGDPQEASLRSALDYLAGRSCTAITATATGQSTLALRTTDVAKTLLSPERPTTPQREVPGLF
ncbi:S41 family peptidase [Sphingomonas sp. MMS12-HWE2-04]|uniref:S41 family peptidase n=1 Tax=Sphingomonas sp. MMS12-HWE2-04 TaxID=3234199 RepID=UPI00384F739A